MDASPSLTSIVELSPPPACAVAASAAAASRIGGVQQADQVQQVLPALTVSLPRESSSHLDTTSVIESTVATWISDIRHFVPSMKRIVDLDAFVADQLCSAAKWLQRDLREDARIVMTICLRDVCFAATIERS